MDIIVWLIFLTLLGLDIYYIYRYSKTANNFKKSIDNIFNNIKSELNL